MLSLKSHNTKAETSYNNYWNMHEAKLRVCAYARVSTKNEEQFTSYANQKEYFENYINKHENWQFVRIYTDEGISRDIVEKA